VSSKQRHLIHFPYLLSEVLSSGTSAFQHTFDFPTLYNQLVDLSLIRSLLKRLSHQITRREDNVWLSLIKYHLVYNELLQFKWCKTGDVGHDVPPAGPAARQLLCARSLIA